MSQFPTIEKIDDVLPAVKGRDEFVVAEREWGTVIDYQITLPDSFAGPHAATRAECRGIKFHKDGTLAARPLHKFHNLGEPQMQVADLAAAGRFHEHFLILDKLDGSMIHPIVVNESVHLCTHMGITDVSANAQSYIERVNVSRDCGTSHCPWYLDFCYDLAMSGMTPVFEWCSRRNRIVLDYPVDNLILTAIRVNRTGEYLTWRKMQCLAEPYKIPMVTHWDGEWDGIEAFLDHVHGLEETEGYILRWDDGTMGKTKGQWYLQIHKAKDHIVHEKRVIGLILNDNLDDVLPFLLERDYDRVVAYREDFWATIDSVADAIETRVRIAKEFTSGMGMDPRAAQRFFYENDVTQYKGDLRPLGGLLTERWKDRATGREIVIAHLRKKLSLDIVGAKRHGSDSIVQDMRKALLLPEKDWLDY